MSRLWLASDRGQFALQKMKNCVYVFHGKFNQLSYKIVNKSVKSQKSKLWAVPRRVEYFFQLYQNVKLKSLFRIK